MPLIRVDTLANLLSVHEKQNAISTILTTDLPDPTGYGRIIRNIDNSFNRIVEERDASNEELSIHEINSGIYIFNSDELFNLLPLVENNNSQNEYYLPDLLNFIIWKKGKVAIEKINNNSEIQGVNNNEQLIGVNAFYENT